MAYYGRGDNYQRPMYARRGRGDYYRGDPGLFGSIGKALGGIARTALGVVGAVAPGPIGTVARAGATLLGGRSAAAPAAVPMPAAPPILMTTSFAGSLPPVEQGPGQRPEPGVRGVVHRALPGGASGYLPRRRMRVTNVKAAHRAIRRLKGVRALLLNIERQLPKHTVRSSVRRSPGVITRAEAARALRG